SRDSDGPADRDHLALRARRRLIRCSCGAQHLSTGDEAPFGETSAASMAWIPRTRSRNGQRTSAQPATSAQRLPRQQPPLLRKRCGPLLGLSAHLVPNEHPAALHRSANRGLCFSKQADGVPPRYVAFGGIENFVDEVASGNVDGLASCAWRLLFGAR